MPMLYGKQWSREELQRYAADMSQLASVQRTTMREGRAEGVEMVEFATGSGFNFRVLPGRGLDISHASYHGIPLCWRTSVGEAAASYYEPEGGAWHRTAFGGLMSTGGLSAMGSTSVDEGQAFGHHGRASNIPASSVWADAEWEGDAYRMWVRGKVTEAEALGTNLVMTREISTELGASHFTIRDRVENRTFQRAAHMILYHFNIGFPLLSDKSRLLTNSQEIIPQNETSKVEFDRWDRFEGPKVGRPHQLFYHKLRPDHEGKVHIILAGMPDYATGPIAAYLSFTHDTLPWFANWKSMIAGDYVTGIEPANAWVEGRAAEREAGRLRFLEPWEAVEYEVQFGVLAGLPAINEFAEVHSLPRVNADLSSGKG